MLSYIKVDKNLNKKFWDLICDEWGKKLCLNDLRFIKVKAF